MLFDQIMDDRIQAMKNKDSKVKSLLDTLKGDLEKGMKVLNGEKIKPSDQECVAMVKRFIGVYDKSIEEMYREKIEPPSEFLDEKKFTEDTLNKYLPSQLDEQEIRDIIATRKDNGDNNIGVLMKFFKDNYAGQYDGALVSKLVKENI